MLQKQFLQYIILQWIKTIHRGKYNQVMHYIVPYQLVKKKPCLMVLHTSNTVCILVSSALFCFYGSEKQMCRTVVQYTGSRGARENRRLVLKLFKIIWITVCANMNWTCTLTSFVFLAIVFSSLGGRVNIRPMCILKQLMHWHWSCGSVNQMLIQQTLW